MTPMSAPDFDHSDLFQNEYVTQIGPTNILLEVFF